MQNIIEGIDNLEEEGSDSINLEPLTLNSILNGAINSDNYVFYNVSFILLQRENIFLVC